MRWYDAIVNKPQEGRRVLAAVIDERGKPWHHIAQWGDGYTRWWTDEQDKRLMGVYAWMPLPDPPKLMEVET